MRTIKCKFCKWSKESGRWESHCNNRNSAYYGDECIEKDRVEPSECEDKEELGE